MTYCNECSEACWYMSVNCIVTWNLTNNSWYHNETDMHYMICIYCIKLIVIACYMLAFRFSVMPGFSRRKFPSSSRVIFVLSVPWELNGNEGRRSWYCLKWLTLSGVSLFQGKRKEMWKISEGSSRLVYSSLDSLSLLGRLVTKLVLQPRWEGVNLHPVWILDHPNLYLCIWLIVALHMIVNKTCLLLLDVWSGQVISLSCGSLTPQQFMCRNRDGWVWN